MQNLGDYHVLNVPEFAVNTQFRLQVHTNPITGQTNQKESTTLKEKSRIQIH